MTGTQRWARVVSHKWDGSLHRDSMAAELGTDEHGTWLWMPHGTTVTTARRTYVAVGGLRLFPETTWWSAFFVPRQLSPARPKQLYVDVTTAAVRSADRIEFVDLDLDVEQLDDGQVTILDEDEFAAHQVEYGYPADVVDRARTTCQEIAAMVAAGSEPFRRAAAGWLEKAAGLP